MRMISNFWKISKSGAMAVRAQPPTFYAPPRDLIAIPASLVAGGVSMGAQRRPATVPKRYPVRVCGVSLSV